MAPALLLLIYAGLLVVRSSYAAIYNNADRLPKIDWDFIIIGGGAAGSVLANRLSENPTFHVLLIEAGGPNHGLPIALNSSIPFFASSLTPNTPWDWNFTTVPQTGMNNQTMPYPRGFVIGGSTSINGMFYTRGSSDDYDRYARVTGDEGWSWDSLQPYFRKNERWTEPADHHDPTGQFNTSAHSTTGINFVSVAESAHAIDSMVLEASKELPDQYPFNLDMNAGDQIGLGWLQLTVGNGTRSSAATSYLAPQFIGRPNLHVVLNTRVTRILPEGKTLNFRYVEFASNPNEKRSVLKASKEVILSAGAIQSPHILLSSGIGDETILKSLKIPTVLNLPEVGKNLSDHPTVTLTWSVNGNDTFDNVLQNYTLQQQLIHRWNESHDGPLSGISVNQIALRRIPDDSGIFGRHEDPSAGPNSAHIEIIISEGTYKTAAAPPPGHFFAVSASLVSPASRGKVSINSSNPFDPPEIDVAFLTDDFDVQALGEGIKMIQQFANASVWKSYIIAPFGPWANISLDAPDEVETFIRSTARSSCHVVGSNKMTARNARFGVVDPDLKVKGVRGLRVIDASVLPFIPAAHTQAATYVFAERGADLIKSEWR